MTAGKRRLHLRNYDSWSRCMPGCVVARRRAETHLDKETGNVGSVHRGKYEVPSVLCLKNIARSFGQSLCPNIILARDFETRTDIVLPTSGATREISADMHTVASI